MGLDLGVAERGGVEVQAPWSYLRTGSRHTKIAFTIQELVGLTSQFSMYRKDGTPRTTGCSSQVVRTDRKQYLFVYRVTCSEKDKDGKLISAPGGHVVRMKFDFKRINETHNANDLDVRVSCSCPAFLFYGPQWNLSTGDALYGAPRPKFQPPTEAQRHQFVICKHVKLVADRISPALERMLAAYRTDGDKAELDEKMKQVQVVRDEGEVEVEQATKPKITPKEEEDLEAMPENLSDIGLSEPDLGVKKRNPITPKNPPATESLPPAPEPVQELPEPPTEEEQQAPGTKRKRMPPKKVGPSNVTVVDDDDQETTILPGSKARRMEVEVEDGLIPDITPLPGDEPFTPPGSKRKRMLAPVVEEKKSLPPNITLVDDEDDEPTILPGDRWRRRSSTKSRLASALIIAPVEV